MNVKIVNKSKNETPSYSTALSAGMDIRANLNAPLHLRPMARMLIPTGLFIQLPAGYEAQIRPRSGMAIKDGITVLNTPGTIDADYRGEIKVVLINLSDSIFVINSGDRIAQMVITTYDQVNWLPAEELDSTERGSGGFGHTGKL